ncbi:hypothetical protein [Scytonema millei]|uniref:hypothetical protein n=1 Tax=Scytonema millei TaxID=1245922 RepID=UPI0013F4BD35|nr:hypothetical protein [Scytonema millei]
MRSFHRFYHKLDAKFSLLLLPTELCCVIKQRSAPLPILASQILIPDYCDRHFLGVATVTRPVISYQ